MASTTNRIQDLPPKGGYGPIQIERIKLRSIIGVKKMVAAFIALNVVGFTSYYYDLKRNKRYQIEMTSAQCALLPLLLAERDRILMKQMRLNRDEETELMKDRKDWVVGTAGGIRTYLTLPEDTWIEPIEHEFYAHSKPSEAKIYVRRNSVLP